MIDAERAEMISLDTGKRTARVRTFGALRQAVDRNVDPARLASSAAPTGRGETILGYSCDQHSFTVRLATRKAGRTFLALSGTFCVSREVPGAGDYAAFLAEASRQRVVLSFTGDSPILVVLAVAHTEMYRLIQASGGVPLKVDSDLRYDGFGSSLMNKFAARRHSEVTAISVAPVAAERFSIPAGCKTVRK